MGIITAAQNDIVSAQHYLETSLRVYKRTDPKSPSIPVIQSMMSALAYANGDKSGAQKLLHDSEKTSQQNPSDSSQMRVVSLSVQGLAAFNLGDLITARNRFLDVLAMCEANNALWSKQGVAACLCYLAQIALLQGNPQQAEEYLQRAMPIWRHITPGLEVKAIALMVQGMTALMEDNYIEAEEQFKNALVVVDAMPDSPDLRASILTCLGLSTGLNGRYMEAEQKLQAAVAIFKNKAPNSADMAGILTIMGLVYAGLGKYDVALQKLEQAFNIYITKAPGSVAEAFSIGLKGEIYLAQNHIAEALPLLEKSVKGLEGQRQLISDIDRRALLLEAYAQPIP